jgi:general secretion pathway protein K
VKRADQRGAALLLAMLVVTLVATFAAGSLWQQWRSVQVETAERSRVQSSWILTGASDWARLILREDARAGGADYLAEPWAVPLEEARLSTFLAADQNNNAEPGADNAFLSGQIIDRQSLLNVNNLVQSGAVSQHWVVRFARLFDLLGLPQAELTRMAENLRFANDISVDNRSASQAPLPPQSVEQLVWLGLPVQTVAALEPFVTLLPASTPVNLNTAPAEVIYAALEEISLADAQRLVAERDRSYFRSIGDAGKLLPRPELLNNSDVSVSSRFFEVRGRLRLDDVTLEERSLVQRESLEVRVLQRDRGVVDPTALTRAAQLQAQAQAQR